MRIIFVWLISAACYMPLYFEQLGYGAPDVLLRLRYLYVAVPLVVALICIKRRGSVKKWLGGLLAGKVGAEPLALCGAIGLFGVLCTLILNRQAWDGISILFNTLYLLCMAALEEMAWRGFYLQSALERRAAGTAVLTVSLEWAVWHIPMWAVRNGLGPEEIVLWLVYTVLVGSILGKSMIRYRNILVPVVLHTIFNVCFLLPVEAGVAAVLCVWLGVFIFEKLSTKK